MKGESDESCGRSVDEMIGEFKGWRLVTLNKGDFKEEVDLELGLDAGQ